MDSYILFLVLKVHIDFIVWHAVARNSVKNYISSFWNKNFCFVIGAHKTPDNLHLLNEESVQCGLIMRTSTSYWIVLAKIYVNPFRHVTKEILLSLIASLSHTHLLISQDIGLNISFEVVDGSSLSLFLSAHINISARYGTDVTVKSVFSHKLLRFQRYRINERKKKQKRKWNCSSDYISIILLVSQSSLNWILLFAVCHWSIMIH